MKKRVLKVLPWVVLAAAYVFSVAWQGLYGSHNLNADDSAEMILAAQLNEEGGILSPNWYYSTELRLASPVMVYQLALRIFPNSWHAARTLASAVVILGVLASLLYMLRGLGLKKSAPWLGALFALPFSGAYAWVVLYQCYYSVHLVLSLLMLGMLVRCGRAVGRRRAGLCAALLVLALISGLNGVRMMTMFIVPVFAAALLTAAQACKAHGTFREAAHEPAVRMFGPALLTAAAAGAGYVINMKMLSGMYSYYNYGLESLGRFALSDFLHQVDGMVDLFGYYTGAAFFSLQGISSLVGFGIVVLLFLALGRMFCRWKELSAPLRLLLMTAAMAVALGMTLNVLLGQTLPRYILVGYLLMMVVLAAALETEPCRNEALRALAGGAVLCCFLFQAGCGLLYNFRQGTVNYEMAAQWLLQNGFTQGYATYWNAFPIEEASNGKITMWGLNSDNWESLTLVQTNQSKNRLRNEPGGPVFLLLDEVQNESDSPLLDEAHLVGDMIGWSYYIYAYDSVDEMRALIAQGAQE